MQTFVKDYVALLATWGRVHNKGPMGNCWLIKNNNIQYEYSSISNIDAYHNYYEHN